MSQRPDTGELDTEASAVRGSEAAMVTTSDLDIKAEAIPKVLAVDDVEQNLKLLEAMLADIPCQVVRAQSGDEALALVATTDFAVMLLDVRMPGMDGYDVAERTRRMSGGKDLPIVFLTASDKSDYGVLRGYGSGAVDVLFKPVQREVLQSKVRVFVELYASRLQVSRTRDALQRSNVELRALAEAKAALVEDARVANAELERAYAHLQATQIQLVQSAKMGALGELVGGLAHEINNPLSFSIGHLDTSLRVLGAVRTTLGEAPPELEAQWNRATERLTQLASGLERIRGIVDKLQTFARFQQSDYEQVSLSKCVEAILAIVRHRLQGRIRVITRFDEPDWLYCFPSLINQGLMSLIQNAIEAIEGEGQISICMGREEDAFVIRITDTGCGIPREIQDRVFEPFFTTKAVGEGVGLGLSVAYSAARGHGGTLELIDGQGGGTEAILRMPLDSALRRVGASITTPSGLPSSLAPRAHADRH